MKKIIKEYKEEFKSFLHNNMYIYSIAIVSLLSYGYFITHVTVGMDDTCLDRYYGDLFSINIISMTGRWGSYFLYKLLNITQFTPLWLEILSVLTLIITAIIISCFIKKNMKPKDNLITIIFSSLYISYSLINEVLIFQPSNFALLLGNMLAILSVILIYELINEGNINKKYIIVIMILTVAISMYESCCQTFLLGLFICMMYIIYNNKNEEKKCINRFLLDWEYW